MERTPEPREHPVYPEEYQQSYPYYYPYPPPKRDDKKIVMIVLAVVLILVVVPTILAFVLYIMVIGLTPNGHYFPTGSWGSLTYVSNTSVRIEFGWIDPESQPVDLNILLTRNYTQTGSYYFPSNHDGTVLVWQSGSNLGTLVYEDSLDNLEVDPGDSLLLTNLDPGSNYRAMMIWEPTGEQLDVIAFSTPP